MSQGVASQLQGAHWDGRRLVTPAGVVASYRPLHLRWRVRFQGSFLGQDWRLSAGFAPGFGRNLTFTAISGVLAEYSLPPTTWSQDNFLSDSSGQKYLWHFDPLTQYRSFVDVDGVTALSNSGVGHLQIAGAALEDPHLPYLILLYRLMPGIVLPQGA